MPDKRQQTRKSCAATLNVTNSMTDTSIGHLGNISSEGFLLISKNRVEEDRIFQLRIDLPKPCDDKTFLCVGAHSIWAHETIDSNRHWTGFEIIDIAQSDLKIVENLLSRC